MARLSPGLKRDDDGTVRCWWGGEHDDYIEYHNREWGRPVDDDHLLFEKICLEGFQSGLSWLTILRKRDRFREVFHGFDFERIARMNKRDVNRLVKDAGIIRHRGKIESVLNNAKRAMEMAETHGSLGAFFWSFEPPQKERPRKMTKNALMKLGKTEASTRLSKSLKKQGWSFVGPTTCYAFMQAMGIVNDHIEGCFARDEVEALRTKFVRPS
jgi:DNA-3-methyladenine glycosylase I